MMKFGEASRVVEPDAGTPVHDGLRLIVQLVVALEDVLQLILGDALARIGDTDLQLTISDIERHVDMSASRRELQRIGDEVGENLLQLVAVGPGHEWLLHAKAVDGDTTLAGIVDEIVADTVDHFRDIEFLDTEAQGVVLELVEVHQLVHELEHTLDIAMRDAEQATVLFAERTALHKLSHGTGNHRERRTELMGDIGEEAHVHLVGAQLLLLLHLRLTGCTTGVDDTTGIAVEVISQGRGEGEVDEPSPPGEGGGWSNDDAQGALFGICLIAGTIGGLHTEGVMA